MITTSWTTDADHNITIKAAPGHEAVVTGWDATRYNLAGTGATTRMLRVRAPYTRIEGLQIQGPAGNVHAIEVSSEAANGNVIAGCRIRNTDGNGVFFASSAGGTVQNTIIELTKDVGFPNGVVITTSGGLAVTVQHCIALGGQDGFSSAADDYLAFNSVAFNNDSDDFDSGVVADHCASDDGVGTNSIAPAGGSWDNEFVDWANGDFTLLATGNLYRAGVALLDGPATDMSGTTWADPPSVGVDEA
jgi:hypothetical protein